MTDSEFRELIADEFAANGLSPEAARGLASFIDAVSKIRAAGELLRLLNRVRPSLPGTVMLRVLTGDPEPLRAAARRLHVSPATLRKAERRFTQLVNTRATIKPDDNR